MEWKQWPRMKISAEQWTWIILTLAFILPPWQVTMTDALSIVSVERMVALTAKEYEHVLTSSEFCDHVTCFWLFLSLPFPTKKKKSLGQHLRSSQRSMAEISDFDLFRRRKTRSFFSTSSSWSLKRGTKRTEYGYGKWDKKEIRTRTHVHDCGLCSGQKWKACVLCHLLIFKSQQFKAR